jgi:tRNA (cmo5U34)-methyltransferase
MQTDRITALFDQQAASYDRKWSKLAPINNALHLLADAVLSGLPSQAHVLCVGAGTGAEILHFAGKFPAWRFTAVEPSTAMLEVLRRRADERGISSRCAFHGGHLDSLPAGALFDAATSFLVSQFIADRPARSAFFQAIANRLRPDGILVCSDLAGDLTAPGSQALLEIWHALMAGNGTSPGDLARMRDAYARDVAVLPPSEVADIIRSGGFAPPTLLFQVGMIHGWYAKRSARQGAHPA